MTGTTATIIEKDGIFAQYTLIIKGPRGGEKAERIAKRYTIDEMPDGRKLINYTSVGAASVGMTSRGTVSSRSYSKKKTCTADTVEIMHQDKGGAITLVRMM